MSVNEEIERLISIYGTTEFEQATRKALSTRHSTNVCTIVANQGVHTFPEEILRGDIFVFSTGNLTLSEPDKFKDELTVKLIDLTKFLSKKKWKEIYLVISGHAVINVNIKLVTYRLTRIETQDWVYNGEQGYFSLQIRVRDVVLASDRSGLSER